MTGSLLSNNICCLLLVVTVIKSGIGELITITSCNCDYVTVTDSLLRIFVVYYCWLQLGLNNELEIS